MQILSSSQFHTVSPSADPSPPKPVAARTRTRRPQPQRISHCSIRQRSRRWVDLIARLQPERRRGAARGRMPLDASRPPVGQKRKLFALLLLRHFATRPEQRALIMRFFHSAPAVAALVTSVGGTCKQMTAWRKALSSVSPLMCDDRQETDQEARSTRSTGQREMPAATCLLLPSKGIATQND